MVGPGRFQRKIPEHYEKERAFCYLAVYLLSIVLGPCCNVTRVERFATELSVCEAYENSTMFRSVRTENSIIGYIELPRVSRKGKCKGKYANVSWTEERLSRENESRRARIGNSASFQLQRTVRGIVIISISSVTFLEKW